MKFVSIVGARPQFIKLSPLCRAIDSWNQAGTNEKIESTIVHTGQHYDAGMSKIFFDQMEIPEPNYNLEVGSGSHAVQTGMMMERIEKVLETECPDVVVVFGDTNSTLAGALTASKMKIPVAHVEAGLRSYNREMPEETNRVIADHISTILFCPTSRAVSNLKREGCSNTIEVQLNADSRRALMKTVSPGNPLLVLTGDIMYDAFLFNASVAEKSSKILEELDLKARHFALLTIHRAESTKDAESLRNIIGFLQTRIRSLPVVFPVHPRTKNFMLEKGMNLPEQFRVIPPVSYHDMIMLEKSATEIFTDSGGVQKEAFFARVPCTTLRTETEWPETIESGWNRMMNDPKEPVRKTDAGEVKKFFGEGKSAEIHLRVLLDFCGRTK